MRKEIAEHLDTLKKSITEIALSGVDNREELLSKSIDQFHTALDPILPQDRVHTLVDENGYFFRRRPFLQRSMQRAKSCQLRHAPSLRR